MHREISKLAKSVSDGLMEVIETLGENFVLIMPEKKQIFCPPV
jgi:hypothetical protein